MQRSPLQSVSRALYDRLHLAITRGGRTIDVFAYVTEGQKFPYISLGTATSVDDSTASEYVREVRISIDYWSRYPGDAELQELMDAGLQRLINGTFPSLGAEFALIDMTLEDEDIFVLADGRTRHGYQLYRLLIEQL